MLGRLLWRKMACFWLLQAVVHPWGHNVAQRVRRVSWMQNAALEVWAVTVRIVELSVKLRWSLLWARRLLKLVLLLSLLSVRGIRDSPERWRILLNLGVVGNAKAHTRLVHHLTLRKSWYAFHLALRLRIFVNRVGTVSVEATIFHTDHRSSNLAV